VIALRIPLDFVQRQLQALALVRFSVLRSKLAFVKFVIDTGSPISTLSAKDSQSLGLSLSQLPSCGITRVGGQSFELKRLKNAQMIFQDSHGATCRFVFSDLNATLPLRKSQKDRQEAESIPSILGMDFLETASLALYCKPVNDVAYFDDDSV